MRRDVFQALADPVRREILELLSKQPLSVNEVATNFEISRQAVSKQLKILKECGLVNMEKQGRERYCSVNPQGLIPAFLWMEQLQKQWEDRIDSFEQYLMQLKTTRNEGTK